MKNNIFTVIDYSYTYMKSSTIIITNMTTTIAKRIFLFTSINNDVGITIL